MKILDSFTLKIIAIITMALDHIYTYLLPSGVNVPVWFGYLGKLAAPIFLYLIVEGFFHTRDRKKYLGRLVGFTIVMYALNAIFGFHNNIFASLSLSIVLMMVMEYFKENKDIVKRIVSIVLILVVSALYMVTEGSIYCLAMTYIFYLCREKTILKVALYIGFSLFIASAHLASPNPMESLFFDDYQWMMIFAIIPILMYNGKLGLKNTFSKWMFYIFYPAHLVILTLIAKQIAG